MHSMIVVEYPLQLRCLRCGYNFVAVLYLYIIIKFVDRPKSRWHLLLPVAPPGHPILSHLYTAIPDRVVGDAYVYLREDLSCLRLLLGSARLRLRCDYGSTGARRT